jgi:predicted DCC family thiol-disulfide oxidoreductase YuxK
MGIRPLLSSVLQLSKAELKGAPANVVAVLNRLHDESKVLIIFDGVCNLCEGAIHFVHNRDYKGQFLYGWAQDSMTHAVMLQFDLKPADLLDSVCLIEPVEDGWEVYRGSTAALRVAYRFSGAWACLATVGLCIPTIVRDVVYKGVAKYRYKMFGEKTTCGRPAPALKAAMIH